MTVFGLTHSPINTKNKYVPPEFTFDFDKICRALKRVRNHEDFEYSDQKHLIENVINMIAEDKLKLDSLGYKRICSQIRMLLNKEQIKYVSKKNSKVTVSFPETEVYITKLEYNKLKKYKDKEEILRAILGVYDHDERTVRISIESPTEINENKKEDLEISKKNEEIDNPMVKIFDNNLIGQDKEILKNNDEFVITKNEIIENKNNFLMEKYNIFQENNCSINNNSNNLNNLNGIGIFLRGPFLLLFQ